MSHLLLNHLSIFDSDGAALKDILSLYAFRDIPETRQLVDAIIRVEARSLDSAPRRRRHGARVPTFSSSSIPPQSTDLRPSCSAACSTVSVGLYTSVNSFTRLTATIKGQSRPVATWRARAAERPLL